MSPHAQLYRSLFRADCDRARALLEPTGITFEEIDLSRDLECCCQLEALTGGRSVPQLARNGGLRPPGRAESAATPL